MMKSAYFRERYNPSDFGSACWARFRGVFAQSQVGSAPVIVREIRREQTVEVSLAEDNNVIQTFAADRTDQTLNVRRLPGRA